MDEDPDIDRGYRPSGMAGGQYSTTIVSPLCGRDNDIPLRRDAGSMLQRTDPLFNIVSMRTTKALGNQSPTEEPMETESGVVDLTKKKSKKQVLEPEPSPIPSSTDRRQHFVFSDHKIEPQGWKTDVQVKDKLKITEEIIGRINLNLRKHQSPQSGKIEGISYDETIFSRDFSKSERDEKLGNGTNGRVVKFKDKKTNATLTRKTIQIAGKFGVKLRLNEVLTPLQCNSPNVVKVLGLGHNGVEAYVIMENAGLSLRQCMGEPPIKKILQGDGVMESVAQDILAGLCELAGKGIAFCDMKPENLCVDRAMDRPSGVRAKIIDLASSQGPDDPATTSDTTPEYLDPAYNAAVSQGCPYKLNDRDDVWGFGLSLLFVAWDAAIPMVQLHLGTKTYPPEITQNHDLLQQVRMHVLKKIGEMSSLPAEFYEYPGHPVLSKVLTQALIIDRQERPSARQLLHDMADLMRIRSQSQLKPKGPEVARKRMHSETSPYGGQGRPRGPSMGQVAGQTLRVKAMVAPLQMSPSDGNGDYSTHVVNKKLCNRKVLPPATEEEEVHMPPGIMQAMVGLDLKAKSIPLQPPTAVSVQAQQRPSIVRLNVVDRPSKVMSPDNGRDWTMLPSGAGPRCIQERQRSQEAVELHSPTGPQQMYGGEDNLDLVNLFLDQEARSSGRMVVRQHVVKAAPPRVSTLPFGPALQLQQQKGQRGVFSGRPVQQAPMFDSGPNGLTLRVHQTPQVIPQTTGPPQQEQQQPGNMPDLAALMGIE